MQNFKIYLSGSMSESTWEEQTKWRKNFRDAVIFGDYDYNKKALFFDPTQYYNFEEKRHNSEREIMDFDLYNLRNSNLVVVNLKNSKSLGTMSELILAHELHIPVIGWNPNNEPLHPWMECCITRICKDMREAVEHVIEFYLN